MPKKLTKHFQVMILADTAFGSVEFIDEIRKLKYHAITGVRCNRQLSDGRVLTHLHKKGQQVRLVSLKIPVFVTWCYLKRDNGKLVKRFVLSTRCGTGPFSKSCRQHAAAPQSNHDYLVG